jgi:hypothetical protein
MFIWHSSNTEESAQTLAQAFECEYGKVPPKGYEGDVICLSPNPSENFKWGERNFGKIINDPRKFKKFRDDTLVVNTFGVQECGDIIRVICINGKVTKVIGEITSLSASMKTSGFEEGLLVKLGNPEFVAIDGVLSKNGLTFIVTKVVFSPALTELPDVIQKLKDEFTEVDDKTALLTLVNSATPEELKALRSYLKKAKNSSQTS